MTATPADRRPLARLKGRDLRALTGFRDRVRAALGKAFLGARFLSRRALDVPPEAAGVPAPPPPPGASTRTPSKLAIQPAPEPPGELRVVILVERRDVWVEERIDEAALETALETGAVLVPFVYTVGEWGSPLSLASSLRAEGDTGDEIP